MNRAHPTGTPGHQVRQAMKTVRSTLDRTCREQAGIWREPTAQATLVFDHPHRPGGLLDGICRRWGIQLPQSAGEPVDLHQHDAVLRTSRRDNPDGISPLKDRYPPDSHSGQNGRHNRPSRPLPLAAFLTLMASIEIVEIFPTGSDIPTGTRIHLGEMLGTHGRPSMVPQHSRR